VWAVRVFSRCSYNAVRYGDGAGNTAEENSSILQTSEGTFRRQKVSWINQCLKERLVNPVCPYHRRQSTLTTLEKFRCLMLLWKKLATFHVQLANKALMNKYTNIQLYLQHAKQRTKQNSKPTRAKSIVNSTMFPERNLWKNGALYFSTATYLPPRISCIDITWSK